jgi:glycosyltransferase involved in cell wall biosynthesis
LQERISFAFADHLITTHELMPRLFVRSASAAKISSIMNVPDPKLFRHSPGHKKTGRGRFTLLYTGTVTYTYDLDTLVHACSRLNESINNLFLRIVGEGDDLDRIKALVAKLQLNDHVEFLPPVPVDQIAAILISADLVIVPHRNDAVMPWGFSTKLAEALLLGIPVIAARTPALTAFFDDTMVAYFEPGNAEELARHALLLHGDETLGEQMVTNARKFFAEHSWEQERARFYHVMDMVQSNSKKSYQEKSITQFN